MSDRESEGSNLQRKILRLRIKVSDGRARTGCGLPDRRDMVEVDDSRDDNNDNEEEDREIRVSLNQEIHFHRRICRSLAEERKEKAGFSAPWVFTNECEKRETGAGGRWCLGKFEPGGVIVIVKVDITLRDNTVDSELRN